MTDTLKRGITPAQIEALYPIVIDVYKGRKTLEEGVKDIYSVGDEMREKTAKFYINFFVKLKKGESHKDGTGPSISSTRYFLTKILSDNGANGLKTTLESLWNYIEYYEKAKGGYKLERFRAIHAEFSEKLK